MAIRAVTFDAYGTLLRNEDLMLIPRRIVADHELAVSIDDVLRTWMDFYFEATQQLPFRTLREIQGQILPLLLRQFAVPAEAATPYVDLYFRVTTKVDLYPETLEVLNGLGPVHTAIVSNADHEHRAAWNFKWPVRRIVISEAVRAYKPHPLMFQRVLAELSLQPHEVLHVGDSDVDDVKGAKAVGLRVAWVNRTGRSRRPAAPPPDFEIRDLTELPALL